MARQSPDPIDLLASAIAAKATVLLAAHIAAAIRRLDLQPPLRSPDPTAAERQRRFRAGKRNKER